MRAILSLTESSFCIKHHKIKKTVEFGILSQHKWGMGVNSPHSNFLLIWFPWSAHALLKVVHLFRQSTVTNGYHNLLQAMDHAYDTLGSHE